VRSDCNWSWGWRLIFMEKLRMLSGWWCNNHLEEYKSQWEGLSHILWKNMFENNNQLWYVIWIYWIWPSEIGISFDLNQITKHRWVI
jgi:hypothetical protein